MRLQNIIITGIALVAIVAFGCGIVCAEEVTLENVGAAPAPIHKYIAGELTTEEINELIKEASENQGIGSTEKIIVAKGIGYYEDQGVEYKDTIRSTTGGIEVTDWIDNEAPEYHKGSLTIPINDYHYVDIEIECPNYE